MANKSLADICVIGTGAAGGVWIDACTRAGLDVVALERGPFLGPADFMQHDERSNIYKGDGFAPDWQDTVREDESEVAKLGRSVLLANCVGGGTAHWGSWSWRFREDDFRVRSTEGAIDGTSLADWPIDYTALAPFYARAEARLGVAGRAGSNPLDPPVTRPTPIPRIRRGWQPSRSKRARRNSDTDPSRLRWRSIRAPTRVVRPV
jgi:choline dehydrogenase-like flavoprotein